MENTFFLHLLGCLRGHAPAGVEAQLLSAFIPPGNDQINALMAETPKTALQVPALRAKMGDWVYYSAFLRMADIAERVSLADEIHEYKALRDLIQRQVDSSGHAEAIKNYLLTQEQRFFNFVVVGVYGGDPDFYELAISNSPQLKSDDLPSYMTGALGILYSMEQKKCLPSTDSTGLLE